MAAVIAFLSPEIIEMAGVGFALLGSIFIILPFVFLTLPVLLFTLFFEQGAKPPPIWLYLSLGGFLTVALSLLPPFRAHAMLIAACCISGAMAFGGARRVFWRKPEAAE